MDQILRVIFYAIMGSRTPAADVARVDRQNAVLATRQRREVAASRVARPRRPPPPPPPLETVTPPPPAVVIVNPNSSAGLGRSFEDRVVKDVLPELAARLDVTPAPRLFRLTRHVAHSGDFAIHFRHLVGFVELKNHSRALPVTDRRRFFDSLAINYAHLDWAILVTSRCSVPHFGEKGYTVVGRVCFNMKDPNKTIPVAFVCGLDGLGVGALETAIRTVTERALQPYPPTWPLWLATDLLERGEMTRTFEAEWGGGTSATFAHPVGSVF